MTSTTRTSPTTRSSTTTSPTTISTTTTPQTTTSTSTKTTTRPDTSTSPAYTSSTLQTTPTATTNQTSATSDINSTTTLSVSSTLTSQSSTSTNTTLTSSNLATSTLTSSTSAFSSSASTTPTTSTPASSTSTSLASASTTSPLQDNNTKAYTGLCQDSASVGGVWYALYPGDCTKVLQCYFNPTNNKTLVVTRQCPRGQFWDQTCLKCLPSWKVACPYDPCKQQTRPNSLTAADSYPMAGVCRGFWSCANERSYPRCCPPLHNYFPDYGCKFGNTCFDQCGSVEHCPGATGVCEKIPVWHSVTDYATVTDILGLRRTTCSQAEFNILDCRCQLKLMDIFMRNGQECKPYHESNNMTLSSGQSITIPIRQLTDFGTIAFQIGLQLSTPYFEITSSSTQENYNHVRKIQIWADQAGIHASFREMSNGGAVASVLFKNVTGEMSVLVVLQQGKLTLAVRHDAAEFVTTVTAKSTKLCSNCDHTFVVTSSSQLTCFVKKVRVYNCMPQVTSIYTKT